MKTLITLFLILFSFQVGARSEENLKKISPTNEHVAEFWRTKVTYNRLALKHGLIPEWDTRETMEQRGKEWEQEAKKCEQEAKNEKPCFNLIFRGIPSNIDDFKKELETMRFRYNVFRNPNPASRLSEEDRKEYAEAHRKRVEILEKIYKHNIEKKKVKAEEIKKKEVKAAEVEKAKKHRHDPFSEYYDPFWDWHKANKISKCDWLIRRFKGHFQNAKVYGVGIRDYLKNNDRYRSIALNNIKTHCDPSEIPYTIKQVIAAVDGPKNPQTAVSSPPTATPPSAQPVSEVAALKEKIKALEAQIAQLKQLLSGFQAANRGGNR